MNASCCTFKQQNALRRGQEPPQVHSSITWKPEPQRPPTPWLSHLPNPLLSKAASCKSGFLPRPACPQRKILSFLEHSSLIIRRGSFWISFPCFGWREAEMRTIRIVLFLPPLFLLGNNVESNAAWLHCYHSVSCFRSNPCYQEFKTCSYITFDLEWIYLHIFQDPCSFFCCLF